MTFCCICRAHSGTPGAVTFHAIPRSAEIRSKWIDVIKKVRDKNVSQYSQVCSQHFCRDEFFYKITINGDQRRYLKRGAIPRIVNNFTESGNINEKIAIPSETPINHGISEDFLIEERDFTFKNDLNIYKDDSSIIRKHKLLENKSNTIHMTRSFENRNLKNFTSPECYQEMKKLIKITETRISTLQKKKLQLCNKATSLKNLYLELHKQGLLTKSTIEDV